MSRPCPYCKSPSARNPCWYFNDHPIAAKDGWDAACDCDPALDDDVKKPRRITMLFWTGIVLVVLGFLLGLFGWSLNTHTPVQQPLPVVGAAMVLVGIGMVLFAL